MLDFHERKHEVSLGLANMGNGADVGRHIFFSLDELMGI